MNPGDLIVTFLCRCGEYVVMKQTAIFTCEHCGRRYKAYVSLYRFDEKNLVWVDPATKEQDGPDNSSPN